MIAQAEFFAPAAIILVVRVEDQHSEVVVVHHAPQQDLHKIAFSSASCRRNEHVMGEQVLCVESHGHVEDVRSASHLAEECRVLRYLHELKVLVNHVPHRGEKVRQRLWNRDLRSRNQGDGSSFSQNIVAQTWIEELQTASATF